MKVFDSCQTFSCSPNTSICKLRRSDRLFTSFTDTLFNCRARIALILRNVLLPHCFLNPCSAICHPWQALRVRRPFEYKKGRRRRRKESHRQIGHRTHSDRPTCRRAGGQACRQAVSPTVKQAVVRALTPLVCRIPIKFSQATCKRASGSGENQQASKQAAPRVNATFLVGFQFIPILGTQ